VTKRIRIQTASAQQDLLTLGITRWYTGDVVGAHLPLWNYVQPKGDYQASWVRVDHAFDEAQPPPLTNWCDSSDDCNGDEYCSAALKCDSCPTGIRRGDVYEFEESGPCLWKCCHSSGVDALGLPIAGTDAGRDRRCSTGITSGDRYSYQKTDTCVWGCCNSDGTDRGWSTRCSTGITTGQSYSYEQSWWPWWTVSGTCFWGCCTTKGYDAGWDYYCDGIPNGDTWQKTVSDTCFWGCCTTTGLDAGWDYYCDGSKLKQGEVWSRQRRDTCKWGCCNRVGTDAKGLVSALFGYPSCYGPIGGGLCHMLNRYMQGMRRNNTKYNGGLCKKVDDPDDVKGLTPEAFGGGQGDY